MRDRMSLKKVNFGEKVLFQLRIGRKPDFIIWVSPKLVTQTESECLLELPTTDVRIARGRKNLILLPGNRNLFNIYVRCALDRWLGWKESSVTIDTSPCEIFAYEADTNHHAALVLTDTSFVEYRWKRAKEQIVEEGFGVVHLDGTVTEIDGEKEDALASLD